MGEVAQLVEQIKIVPRLVTNSNQPPLHGSGYGFKSHPLPLVFLKAVIAHIKYILLSLLDSLQQ